MTLQVIVGGQFGSEGKGAIAAHLAKELPDLLAVRVAGPNAGHTVIGRCPSTCPERNTPDGIGGHHPEAHPWRLRSVPVAAVTREDAILALGPGSEIDPSVTLGEIGELDDAGYRVSQRLWVDYTATVIEPRHQQTEQACRSDGGAEPDFAHSLVATIGSTGKGIGAARADRAMRTAHLIEDNKEGWPFATTDVGDFLRQRLAIGGNVQIEGTQGYGLGQHAGFYPYCTSSDCTAVDFLAMAGCPPWLAAPDDLEIWVVYRTLPIRVAGNSGPLRHETTWEQVGQPEEYTTVTRKVRRVGLWDAVLARQAFLANGHQAGRANVFAALTMADYLAPGLAGCRTLGEIPDQSVQDQFDQIVSRYSKDIGALIRIVGTGPASVIDMRSSSNGSNRIVTAGRQSPDGPIEPRKERYLA